jgi:hypothetical protein
MVGRCLSDLKGVPQVWYGRERLSYGVSLFSAKEIRLLRTRLGEGSIVLDCTGRGCPDAGVRRKKVYFDQSNACLTCLNLIP